jgi:hypothetical protein
MNRIHILDGARLHGLLGFRRRPLPRVDAPRRKAADGVSCG